MTYELDTGLRRYDRGWGGGVPCRLFSPQRARRRRVFVVILSFPGMTGDGCHQSFTWPVPEFDYSGNMEITDAVGALNALAHPGRLAVFRLLVKVGPEGLAAGEIAKATGSLANTLSSNLGILSSAGLVTSRREGRSIIYAASFDRMRQVLGFLVDDCCNGSPEICGDLNLSTKICC